jgi:hypothetical protein
LFKNIGSEKSCQPGGIEFRVAKPARFNAL